MRIIAGNFKGRKILEPIDKKTRPLKDLTKESIFNIINHSNLLNINLSKCSILDLFSGVGSFGLECISQGALYVMFSENYKPVLEILNQNINSLQCQDKTKIINQDIFDQKFFQKINKKFDIIFCDPPFIEENIQEIISNIQKFQILNKDGVIIVHRHKNSNDLMPKEFKIIKENRYGISKIIFAKLVNQ
tara:strand:- start:2683 stop:3252 length:570 start_codon:yes stop_codon:yes gene_type:complete